MAQYTKEQYWAIYEKLPQELKEAVFSAETAEHIATACERNNVQEMSKVAAAVGDVLMGVTMPVDFVQVLQKEVGLKPAAAQSVAQEINRFVFFPVKQQLEEIHSTPAAKPGQAKDIGIATPRHEALQQKAGQPQAQRQDDYFVQEEEKEEEVVEEPKQISADPYRESAD